METPTPKPVRASLHPMIWVATLSVTAASLVGIASMTGLITPHAAEPAAVAARIPTPIAATAVVPTKEMPPTVAQETATKPATPLHKSPPRRERRDEPVEIAQYSGGPSYGGIPVNKGTRADGAPLSGSPQSYNDTAPTRVYSSAPRCSDCGTVESVRQVSREGEGSGVGAVAGGVVGGALGNGVGQGNGRALATIAGAVGGAMLGNKIEKDQKKTTQYESTIRMEDGSRRTITTDSPPAWRQGDPVQVDHGRVLLR